jgi:soluble lytic murein transglycosylase-like protein
MKNLLVAIVVSGCVAVSASAQNSPRVFDNFDTSKGVEVYTPPPPPAPAKKVMKKNKYGKWVVAVEDKLVKRTVQSRPVLPVSESLALREGQANLPSTRLTMGSSVHLKGFTTGDPLVDSYIVDSSRRYNVDPLLIYSQMHQESTFKSRATSPKGASGLMQLMPGTARRFGVEKIYDPKQNIEGGVRYMRWLLDTFNGDVVLALAGYNAGEGAVMKYGWQVPPYRETQEYVRRITDRYNSISDPRYVQTARRVSGTQAARLEKKESRPLTVLEPEPLTIRLPDGNMMLVNQ